MKNDFLNIKKTVNKQEVILILFFSLAFVFNFCVFNQLDVLLLNQNELGLSAMDVLRVFLLIAFVLSSFLAVCLFFICKINKISFRAIISVLSGLMLATYLQSLILNGNSMNILDGSEMFKVSKLTLIINSIAFFMILVFPIALNFIFIKKEMLMKKITLLMSVIIIGMQIFGLIGSAINAPPFSKHNKSYYFSIDDYLKLSENENIIVFVMDRLGTDTTLNIFEKWEESKDIFNGFTLYKNNLSECGQTFPSIAQTLTGYKFEKAQSQIEFLPNAWENAELFDLLHENDYLVNGLLDNYSAYYNIEEVIDAFDNIKTAEIKINYSTVIRSTSKLALGRNMPFIIKNKFAIKNYSNLSNQFVSTIEKGYYPKAASPQTDLFYNSELTSKGLSNTNKKNTFNIVHLNSSHNPYVYDSNLALNSIDALEQTYGSFKILKNYFDQLKKIDCNGTSLFEKSTIIVLADHGEHWTKHEENEWTTNAYASLFIKQKGVDENNPIVFDETTQMSNGNFYSTIFDLIGENDKKPGMSYFDVIANGGVQERYYYVTEWTGFDGSFNSLTKYKGKYKIIGDAYNLANWQLE